MDGFESAGHVAQPAVDVADATRDRLMHVACAISLGATPEDISEWLADGFPAHIGAFLNLPLQADEMRDHVSVILAALQSPAALAA